MSNAVLRFVHASDLHLERPLHGLVDVPDGLRELFLEAPYRAAVRLFDHVLAADAQFLILAGDVAHPGYTSPRGPLFLVEQFNRLAERGIDVYWAGGQVDPLEAWPAGLPLPPNVHRFPATSSTEFVVHNSALPVRLMGRNRRRQTKIRHAEFRSEKDEYFTIAVAHGEADATLLKNLAVEYWALGGSHRAKRLAADRRVAHYPGTHQGRNPDESGAHGCSLVQVDDLGRIAIKQLVTDVVRWRPELVEAPEDATAAWLEGELRQRLQTAIAADPAMTWLVSATVSCGERLEKELAYDGLMTSLLRRLAVHVGLNRPQGLQIAPPPGSTPPAFAGEIASSGGAYCVSVEADPTSDLSRKSWPPQTLAGDFTQLAEAFLADTNAPLDLTSLLESTDNSPILGKAAIVRSPKLRQRLVRKATGLGVELLSGEGPKS